jgi:hypothetical protein
MKSAVGLILMLLARAVTAQTPSAFVITDNDCTWAMPLDETEIAEWLKSPANTYACDGVGIKEISVDIRGRNEDNDANVRGTIYFRNKIKQRIVADLDLLDGDKVIGGQIMRTDEKVNESESYKIFSPVPLSYHITFRITIKRRPK